MKNSNIPWIGEIPQDWEVCKIKNVGEAIIGLTYDPNEVSEKGLLVLRSSNIQNGKISLEDSLYLEKKVAHKFKLQYNDILICSRNGSKNLIGKCALIDERTTGQTFGAFMTVLRTKFPKWLFYIFNSSIFDYYLASFLTSTVNQLTSGNLNNISIPLPPLQTQQKIADFLDSKCSKIDSTIEQEKQHIEKLKEYHQSLITEAVTKGLDKNTPMKDSGIEWIGEIPQGWEVTKLKKVGIIKGRIGFKGYTVSDLVDEDSKGRAIVLGGTNIMKGGYISYEKLTYLSEYKYLESPEIMLNGDEILITKVGAGTGENARYEYYSERVTINPNVMIFVPLTINSHYINYYLLSTYCKNEIFLESNKSGAQPAINQEFVKNLYISCPPLNEQKQIADYLDTKTAQIDNAIAKKETLITKLQEYKKSLIFEAVTGKMEI